MSKKIAILQSNYIPWKGYFDMIAAVDEFILYDDVQYTLRDWRNRNQIKSDKGLEWLTIPVGNDFTRRIRDVEIPDAGWQRKHWAKLETNYKWAPHFKEVAHWLAPLYHDTIHTNLSYCNRLFLEMVCGKLGIRTPLTNSWDYVLIEGQTARLVDLCRQANATELVCGPAVMNYIDRVQFEAAGLTLTLFDYSGYPEYPQLHGPFVHTVSILDLLFNCGQDAPKFMKFGKS